MLSKQHSVGQGSLQSPPPMLLCAPDTSTLLFRRTTNTWAITRVVSAPQGSHKACTSLYIKWEHDLLVLHLWDPLEPTFALYANYKTILGYQSPLLPWLHQSYSQLVQLFLLSLYESAYMPKQWGILPSPHKPTSSPLKLSLVFHPGCNTYKASKEL